jgi:hypothetical protein
MFEFSEWAALALESGRFTDAGYGNDGKWGRSTVHSRSANSGEEMEVLSGTTLSSGVYSTVQRETCSQLTLSASPRFFGGVNSRGWESIKSTKDRHSAEVSTFCGAVSVTRKIR